MNMHKFLPTSLVAISTSLACISAHAQLAPERELAQASSAQLRAAYLRCDRLTSEARVKPEITIACERVGEVLRDRDFGGDWELQLQWWRTARAASRPYEDTEILPARTGKITR
jgi:hypothetical protein